MKNLNVTDLHISSCRTVTLRLDGSIWKRVCVWLTVMISDLLFMNVNMIVDALCNFYCIKFSCF